MGGLKTHVDSGIKDAKDLVSATFATLDLYSALQSSLSGIRQDVATLQQSLAALDSKLADEIGKVRTDLTAAIGASETSMQAWVNDKLSGYYSIAQTEAKLAALKSSCELADESLQGEIAALEASLAAAKNDLTQAYRAAIEEAILTNDGVVDSKIASAISEAQSALAETISGILSRLDDLESRVSALEDQLGAIIAAVQSVVSVPDYTDGSVQIDKVGITDLRFEVFPLSAAGRLAEAGTSVFSLDYVETRTKSGALANIPISEVSFDGEFLFVSVDGMDMDDDLKNGTRNISARLCISDGTITRSSSYFPICFAAPELKAVDLGLSVKWASMNIGASSPEEYGGYYQWGGLQDVTDTGIYLDWSNCPYHTGSDSASGWMKYIPSDRYVYYWSGSGSPDNKTILDPEDDVAHVKLGGKWRMPTKDEWDELCNTSICSWTWTSINGINGYKVQSKKTGFTNNWIFLPAAGSRSRDPVSDAGSIGYYWSSLLRTGGPHAAYNMYFSRGDVHTTSAYFDRCCGLSVRPVSE